MSSGRARWVIAVLVVLGVVACRRSSAAVVADAGPAKALTGEVVTFPSGDLVLHGVLYRPAGPGPFPAVLFNHGSAGGMLSADAAEALGPSFIAHGWVFFMPFRRGQGLSASAGPYVLDVIQAARETGGARAASTTMVRLLETDHLDDQLAALAWLRQAPSVDPARIAVGGTSFGGIETVLGAERASYCAAFDASGGAMSWADSPELQERMKKAVRAARAPIYFFQAKNDFDLTPTEVLSATMKDAGLPFVARTYPPYGHSAGEGHTLGYFGFAIWGDDVLGFLGQHCGAPAGHP